MSETNTTSTIVLRPSLRYFWGLWILFVVSVVAGLNISEILDSSGVPRLFDSGGRLVAWLPFAILLYIFWKKYNSCYYLKEDEIAIATGLLGFYRTYVSARYSHILGVSARQSIIDVVLNTGNLAFGTAESSSTELVLSGVGSPGYYRKLVEARVERAKNAMKEERNAVGT